MGHKSKTTNASLGKNLIKKHQNKHMKYKQASDYKSTPLVNFIYLITND